MPRGAHGRHHPVGTDDDHVLRIRKRHRLVAQRPRAIGRHGLHDVANEGLVLRPRGREARRFVAAPHDHVRGALDLLHLVAIAQRLVAGEVDHLRSRGARSRPDGEQHRVAQPAAHQGDRGVGMDLGGRAGRPHQHHGLAHGQGGTEVGAAAHLQRNHRDKAALRIGPGAGHRQAFHRQQRGTDAGLVQPLGAHFVVLQPVELAGLEGAGGSRGVQHHLHDGRRQAVHLVHGGGERCTAGGDQFRARNRRGRVGCQHVAHHGVAALGPAHGLHHIAEEARMQITEEGDEAAVFGLVHQHIRPFRLRKAALRRHAGAGEVDRLEILAVQLDAPVLARQHGVGLGAGGHDHRACRQHRLAAIGARHP